MIKVDRQKFIEAYEYLQDVDNSLIVEAFKYFQTIKECQILDVSEFFDTYSAEYEIRLDEWKFSGLSIRHFIITNRDIWI